MARKRQIDPGIWTSEHFINLSQGVNDLGARQLFIGMVSNADDERRLKASPAYLKMIIFPGDDFTPDQILEWRKRIEKEKFCVVYAVNGTEYAQIAEESDFDMHQYVNKPLPSKIPPPPNGAVPEPSRNNTAPVPSAQKKTKPRQTIEQYKAELRQKYSDLDFDAEMEKYHLFWYEGKRKPPKNVKLALRNWFDKAREYKAKGGNNGTGILGKDNRRDRHLDWAKAADQGGTAEEIPGGPGEAKTT